MQANFAIICPSLLQNSSRVIACKVLKLSTTESIASDFNPVINTVKPLLSGHLRDPPKCSLNRGCPLNRGCKNCAMFVNDQDSKHTL